MKGFVQAIQGTFPKTEVQLCIVHQIRNSLKYVASKDQKAFMKDLKTANLTGGHFYGKSKFAGYFYAKGPVICVADRT